MVARGPVDDRILDELQTILAAAEAGDGAERDGDELKKLRAILKEATVAETVPDSKETFGLSGASFFADSHALATQGSEGFITAVRASQPAATHLDVGKRDTGVHDEVAHITEHPGVTALLSTQAHCLFCYGLIHGRGYQHGEMRTSPWPQLWEHDYLDFRLAQTSPRMDAISTHPIVELSCRIRGRKWTAYYVVTDLRAR